MVRTTVQQQQQQGSSPGDDTLITLRMVGTVLSIDGTKSAEAALTFTGHVRTTLDAVLSTAAVDKPTLVLENDVTGADLWSSVAASRDFASVVQRMLHAESLGPLSAVQAEQHVDQSSAHVPHDASSESKAAGMEAEADRIMDACAVRCGCQLGAVLKSRGADVILQAIRDIASVASTPVVLVEDAATVIPTASGSTAVVKP